MVHPMLVVTFVSGSALLLALGCGSASEEPLTGYPATDAGGGGSPGGDGASPSGSSGGGANGSSGANGNAGGSGTSGTGFPGSGTGFAGDSLSPGLGPDTNDACPAPPASTTTTQVVSSGKSCFYGDTPDPDVPAATIEQIIEVVNGQQVVHIRITFNPTFVDNTYGENAVGWGAPPSPDAGAPKPKPGAKGGHTFNDLVGSDHIELELYNGDKALSFQGNVDYVSADPTSPCGYGTLGVTGGEGKVIVGSASDVLAVATSLDRDLNGCGHCLTESSPATDASYAPNPDYPDWDYRVVYELWLDAEAFGTSGYAYAVIRTVHASPSKIPGTNTVSVTPAPCPPGWNVPYCEPGVIDEGLNCGGGVGGSGGNSPDGGGVCPPGTVPDLASEGRFCVEIQ